jgi:tetratricopeptide (TPR) repeat protein
MAAALPEAAERDRWFARLAAELRSGPRPSRARGLAELAYLYSRWGDGTAEPAARRQRLATAAELYAEAAALAPHDAALHRSWGQVLLGAGELEAARERLERAQELGPRAVDTPLVMARVHLERGDLAAAEASLGRALTLDEPRVRQLIAGMASSRPRDWRAQRDLALFHGVRGEPWEALAATRAALAAAPPGERPRLTLLLAPLHSGTAHRPPPELP